MIRIGLHECSECNSSDTTLLQIRGKLVFEGETHIGRGSKNIVYKDAILELGDDFAIYASSTISCRKHMKFSKNIQFSWDSLVMESQAHAIMEEQGNRINPNSK